MGTVEQIRIKYEGACRPKRGADGKTRLPDRFRNGRYRLSYCRYIKTTIFVLITATLLLLTWTAGVTAGSGMDNDVYAQLLKQHVYHGRVDYAGFKQDEPRLDQYLSQLGNTDPDRLDRSGQMAFYINLYNAATIKLILTAYPGITSIKDLGTLFQSPWKKKFITLNGQTVTLDHIEHEILRPRFKDPRVHFAVNCASKSCPPLLAEPYSGRTLDAQLDRVTTNFINDPKNNYIQGDRLYVSRVFKWFSEDFADDIKGFVSKYALGEFKNQLDARISSLQVKYLEYDWSLNGS